MSSRCSLPAETSACLTALIAASRDGCPPDRAHAVKMIERATSPTATELVAALAGGQVRQDGERVKFTVMPAPAFRAPNYTPGDPVEIAFFAKTGRFVSTAAPSARLGIVDLAAHVWALRAPDVRAGAEVRLLALIGQAFLHALAEGPLRSAEAA